MADQRLRTRLRAFTSIVAGFLTLFVLTLVLAPRTGAIASSASADLPSTISRANIDGTGKDLSFIETREACGVAVDEGHIYWGTGDGIGRANLDGSDVDEGFITGMSDACSVAVDRAHVYWADLFGGPIGRANLDGSGVNPDFIPGVNACALAVDSAHIYWITQPPDPLVTFPGSMGRANLDGTGVDPNFIAGAFEPARFFSCALAVDAAHVYWGDSFTVPGSIGRANLDGTGVTDIITGFGVVPSGGMAVDASHIYWPEGGPIARVSIDGTDLERGFVTGGNESSGVALDAHHIYWTNAVNPSEVLLLTMKRDKKRGTATLFATVPGPGVLKLRGKWAVKKTLRATRFSTMEPYGDVGLPVKAKGKKRKQLNRRGRTKLKAKVTYTPDGGEPNTRSKRLKLVKRR